MKRIVLLLAALWALTGCRQIETITTKTTVTVDSVQVSVPMPGHELADTFGYTSLFGDSLIFEDARLRIVIVPDTSEPLPTDAQPFGAAVSIDSTVRADRHPPNAPPRFKIEAQIKPDTAQVKVAEKTITTEKETVKYKKQMPWWGWMVIGGLLSLFLLLLFMRGIGWK